MKMNFVEINAPSLTEFTVHSNRFETENFQIKISGAKLLEFDFFGYSLANFDLSASSVFSASVDFLGYPHDLQGIRKNGLSARLLLKGCLGLNQLRISGAIVEAIAQSNQGPPLPKLNMLKRLEICSKCDIEAFLKFLHSTPYLECIELNTWQFYDYDYDLVESVPCVSP